MSDDIVTHINGKRVDEDGNELGPEKLMVKVSYQVGREDSEDVTGELVGSFFPDFTQRFMGVRTEDKLVFISRHTIIDIVLIDPPESFETTVYGYDYALLASEKVRLATEQGMAHVTSGSVSTLYG